ncbi:MAG: ABC transporter permease [Bdellovibrionales bacterium]|nr:ABC transporter permease [Bdellovibrionales bacterium]
MNGFLLKLCWKNLWRNKRRTILAVNAIAIGGGWLIWASNYIDALNRQFIENAIRYQNGHLTVAADGFNEYKDAGKFLADPSTLEQWLSKNPSVKAYSPKILAQGLLSSARGSSNIFYLGIRPEMDRRTTEFHSRIVEGSYFDGETKNKPIVIGKGLKERLNVRVGSKLVALTQGVDGSIGNELFYVQGVFNTESEADKSLAFIRLEDARALLSLPGNSIHQFSVMAKDETQIPALQAELQAAFSGESIEALSWMELQRHLMASIEVYNAANKIFMFIILFIASVGIANSILMSIMERTREFGVMMAIGTTKAEMVRMVLLETLLLAAVGVVVGNLLGIAITYYFQQTGFDLAWLTAKEIRMNGALINTVSYPAVHWIHNLIITTTVMALSILAALLPIHHITKLKATAALKTN